MALPILQGRLKPNPMTVVLWALSTILVRTTDTNCAALTLISKRRTRCKVHESIGRNSNYSQNNYIADVFNILTKFTSKFTKPAFEALTLVSDNKHEQRH
jgi:hypothetical protein